MILIFAFFGSIFIKHSWGIGISPGNSNQPCVPFWRGVRITIHLGVIIIIAELLNISIDKISFGEECLQDRAL